MDDFNTFDMFCDGSDLQFVEADDYWDKMKESIERSHNNQLGLLSFNYTSI